MLSQCQFLNNCCIPLVMSSRFLIYPVDTRHWTCGGWCIIFFYTSIHTLFYYFVYIFTFSVNLYYRNIYAIAMYYCILQAMYDPSLINYCLILSIDSVGYSVTYTDLPANMTRLPNAWLMLAQRPRRWANNSPALGQCLVFAGSYHLAYVTRYHISPTVGQCWSLRYLINNYWSILHLHQDQFMLCIEDCVKLNQNWFSVTTLA